MGTVLGWSRLERGPLLARKLPMTVSTPNKHSKRMLLVNIFKTLGATPSSSTPITDATTTSNGNRTLSRHSSISDSILPSVATTSVVDTQEDCKHYNLEDPRTSPPPMPNMPASGVTSKRRSRLSLPTLLAFVALCLSIFLVALDAVLIPTALLSITLSFHIPDSLYAWVGSAYLLANGASVPFWGKLSDIFGRKPVILTANIIFLGGSVICAVCVNAEMLLGGRVVQGFGGGGVVVMVHVCISDLFEIRDRSFYLGIVGAVWAVGSALGPVLGGTFAEHLTWRWCFYINRMLIPDYHIVLVASWYHMTDIAITDSTVVPIISVSIVTLYVTLSLHNPCTPLLAGLASLDWLGTGTILAAAVFLLVGLQLGSDSSFLAPMVVSFIVLGCVLHIAFPLTQWWEEKQGRDPLLPLRIFRDVSNLSALSVCACDALTFNSVAYFLPLYFQTVHGQTPSTTGVYMLAIAIPLAIISFASGYVIERTGRFLEILQAGLLLMTIGVGLLISLNTTLKNGSTIAILIVIGLGFGPNFGAPLIALQTRIRESDIATGTAAFGFVRMISGAIGVVVSQVVFQMLMTPQLDDFIKAGISRDLATQLAHGKAISLTLDVAMLPNEQKLVARKGLSIGLRGTWVFYTIVSALGLLVSFSIKRKKLQREVTNYNAEFESVQPEITNERPQTTATTEPRVLRS